MKRVVFDPEYIVNVAKSVFDEQTGEELGKIKDHFGKAYNEAKIIAEIATKMVLRIANLPEEDMRSISPVDDLVSRGVQKLF